MPVYREVITQQYSVEGALSEVWDASWDADLFVELDPRLERLDVVEGVYGETGCRVAVVGVLNGVRNVSETLYTAVDAPRSYSKELVAPDSTALSTYTYSERDGVVDIECDLTIVTRSLNIIEYAALWATRRSRRKSVQATSADDAQALRRVVALRRARG